MTDPKIRREILEQLGSYQRANIEEIDFNRAFSDAYDKETDRGFVVILGSLTEDHLLGHVLDRLKPVSPSMRKQLTRSGGALGSWSQIITVALAMGIIDQDDANDLEVFKVLRNACAHSRQHIDFNTPQIRGAIGLLMSEGIAKMRATKVAKSLYRRLVHHSVNYIWGRFDGLRPKRTPEERFDDWVAAMKTLPKRSASPRKRPTRSSKEEGRGPTKPKRSRPPRSSRA